VLLQTRLAIANHLYPHQKQRSAFNIVNTILDRTVTFLMEQPGVSDRTIRSLYLTNYFTVVELDDTSIGASWSDYKLSREHLTETQSTMRSLLNKDPLLVRFTQCYAATDGIARSIRTAIVSALSTPILCTGEDQYFIAARDFPFHFFRGIKYAVVIGFGGYLDYLIRRTSAQRIHVSDLQYQYRKKQIEREIGIYRKKYPSVQLSVSDGSDSRDHLQKADFVSITGSTLANDTLELLLDSARDCGKIILQGESASIHPKELFAAGVHLVVTTLKTRDVAKAAFWHSTRDGLDLCSWLEGNLKPIYLWPKITRD